MKRLIGAAMVFICSAGAASADINATVDELLAEVKELSRAHDARWGYNAAPATLREAFEKGGNGFSMRYIQSWSGWLWIDWNETKGVYENTTWSLLNWRSAVKDGRAGEAETTLMLQEGVERLRDLTQQMEVWFEDDLKNEVERGLWIDRANAVGCCGDAWNYYHERAGHAFDDSISRNYDLIGNLSFIPPVPEAGGVPKLPAPQLSGLEQRAIDAINSGDAAAVRGLIRDAEALLHFTDDAGLQELSQLLSLIGDRLDYEQAPVADLLDRAEEMEDGPLRDAVLQSAQDELMDRAGHMAEILASSASGGNVSEEERASARTWILDNAKRLSQLADDAQFRFDQASGASRLFAGLSGASKALDAVQAGDVRGSEAAEILQDLGDSLPGAVSPFAPFSGPMGAVSAQLDSTRSGFELAAQALDGVSDAIGGDASGLDRSQSAAQQLEEVLSPKRIVANMTDGFVKGVVNNVPFARSIYDWLKS